MKKMMGRTKKIMKQCQWKDGDMVVKYVCDTSSEMPPKRGGNDNTQHFIVNDTHADIL